MVHILKTERFGEVTLDENFVTMIVINSEEKASFELDCFEAQGGLNSPQFKQKLESFLESLPQHILAVKKLFEKEYAIPGEWDFWVSDIYKRNRNAFERMFPEANTKGDVTAEMVSSSLQLVRLWFADETELVLDFELAGSEDHHLVAAYLDLDGNIPDGYLSFES